MALALLVWGTATMLQGIWGRGPLADVTLAGIAPFAATWIGLRAFVGLYPGYGLDAAEELRRQTYAVLATLAVAAVFGMALHVGHLMSRLLLFVSFLGLLALAPLARTFLKRELHRAGLWGKPVVIIGVGDPASNLVRLFQEQWQFGYRPVAIFDNNEAPVDGKLEGVPYGGTVCDALFSDWSRQVDTAIFAMPYTRRARLAKYVHQASDRFRHVMFIPNLSGVTNSAVVARNLAGTFSVEIKYNLLDPWALKTKRALDLTVAILGGVVVFPVIVVLALLVWLESGRPIFYRDWRTGRNGRLFSCIKLRTMLPDAEARLQRLLEENPESRKEYFKYHKLRDDPRVTRIGRFLRKTSLDELPQLLHVLKGEMSLVGPRPYLPRESADVGETQGEILRVPPGITGPWQVSGRNHTSFEERVQMDAHYVRDWSIWLDLVLLARTVKSVFSGGAY
jgi:Undecaprenyl-phosphate galactose phosphotransferase WbaP